MYKINECFCSIVLEIKAEKKMMRLTSGSRAMGKVGGRAQLAIEWRLGGESSPREEDVVRLVPLMAS